MRHAELPLAMNASVRRMTGVITMAMRAASKAIWKQFAGLTAARTQSGDSAVAAEEGLKQVGLLCFAGRPAEGPPRCTSITTSGSSAITARPIPSGLQCETGTGSRGHREVSGIACADGGAYSGDFILHLDSLHTPRSLRFASSWRISVAELWDSFRGRGAGRSSPEAMMRPPCGGGVAGDVGIYARLGRRCVDTVDGESYVCCGHSPNRPGAQACWPRTRPASWRIWPVVYGARSPADGRRASR